MCAPYWLLTAFNYLCWLWGYCGLNYLKMSRLNLTTHDNSKRSQRVSTSIGNLQKALWRGLRAEWISSWNWTFLLPLCLVFFTTTSVSPSFFAFVLTPMLFLPQLYSVPTSIPWFRGKFQLYWSQCFALIRLFFRLICDVNWETWVFYSEMR